MRRWLVGATGGVLALVLAGAVGWALRIALEPAAALESTARWVTTTVEKGSVSRTIRLSAAATWVVERTLPVRVSGVVTAVTVDASRDTSPGETVLTVDLRPVVVGRGDVPAFRDLARGASGDDVRQLQALLQETGFASAAPSGTFDAATSRAVRAWQKAHGLPVDGVVRAGDVIYVPRLPARLRAADGIGPGSTVATGDDALGVLAAEPRFRIDLQEEQVDLVLPGTAVDVHGPQGEVWRGAVSDTVRPVDGTPHVTVRGSDDTSLCADACGTLPQDDEVLLLTEVHVVPRVDGPVVPAGAVSTAAGGETFVTTEDGRRVTVSVRAQAGGSVVVDGVPVGTAVRIPAAS